MTRQGLTLFLGALGHESLELLVGVDGSLLGGLDGLQIGVRDGSHAFDDTGQFGLLGAEASVDGLDGLAGRDSLGQHGLDLGQAFGHGLLASLLGQLGEDLGHLALDHRVEDVPLPSADGVVDSV